MPHALITKNDKSWVVAGGDAHGSLNIRTISNVNVHDGDLALARGLRFKPGEPAERVAKALPLTKCRHARFFEVRK